MATRDFKTYPTAGYMYTIIPGDYLIKIASIAYGEPEKWKLIYKANQAVLRSGDPNLIFPGEIIWIPGKPERKKLEEPTKEDLPGKDKDDFTLVINGHELPVISGSFTTALDTICDGWACEIAWEPGKDKILDQITAKFSYSDCRIYLGGKLQGTGKLYIVGQGLSENGNTKKLEFYSLPMDMIRSTAKPPYERANVSLLGRCKEFAEQFGISVEVDTGLDPQFTNDINSVFPRVTIGDTEKIGDHLLKIARQKGVLITCDRHGNLLLTRSKLKGKIADTLQEGKSPFPKSFECSFNGLERFNTYRFIGQTPGKTRNAAIARDDAVKGNSHTTVHSHDTKSGDIRAAADYAKNKAVADSYTQELPVSDWYLPKGDLLKTNMLIDIVSPSIDAPNGFTFLISRIHFEFTAGGTPAKISIVPPEVYGKGELNEAEV